MQTNSYTHKKAQHIFIIKANAYYKYIINIQELSISTQVSFKSAYYIDNLLGLIQKPIKGD